MGGGWGDGGVEGRAGVAGGELGGSSAGWMAAQGDGLLRREMRGQNLLRPLHFLHKLDIGQNWETETPFLQRLNNTRTWY